MTALIIIARRCAPTTLLANALFVVILVGPFSVLWAGLWLSFAVVSVIFLSMNRTSAGLGRGGKPGRGDLAGSKS